MLKSEVVEQRLEDGELGLQGVKVLVAKGSAVGGVLIGEGGAILESGEPDAATGRHMEVCSLYDRLRRLLGRNNNARTSLDMFNAKPMGVGPDSAPQTLSEKSNLHTNFRRLR